MKDPPGPLIHDNGALLPAFQKYNFMTESPAIVSQNLGWYHCQNMPGSFNQFIVGYGYTFPVPTTLNDETLLHEAIHKKTKQLVCERRSGIMGATILARNSSL